MEQKFNIAGTPDELQFVLEREFKLSEETARVAVAVMIYEQNQEQNKEELEEDTFWYLNSEKEEYQSHIFSTRYTISFTQAMLDVLDELLVPGILALCGATEFVTLSEVLVCIKSLIKNVRRIKDNECCIYFQALKYLKNHSNCWFSIEDVIPDIGTEEVCINLDKNWKCKFKCDESCTIQKKDVKDILNVFCNDAVMEPNENKTLYKFKV